MGDSTRKSDTPRVLIVGAGISGLVLAQSLRKQGVPFEIFERDARASSRVQGYAVGLYNPEGVLRDSLPRDVPPLETANHLLPLPLKSQLIFHGLGGRMSIVEDTPETPCLRTNRQKLRELLSTNLNIQYGKTAARIVEGPDKVTVVFVDETSATGDIVVGADGTYSAVRPHVLKKSNDEVLKTVPFAVISGAVQLSGEVMERQLQLGHSGWVAFGPDYSLFTGINRVNVDKHGKVGGDYYWLMLIPDIMVTNQERDHWVVTSTSKERLEIAKSKVQDLDKKFRAPIELTTVEGMRAWPLWKDAEIPTLPPVNRVVLCGDAAHPIIPARGEGAIHAIYDAVNLGKVLGSANRNDMAMLRATLDKYHKEIAARGNEASQLARGALDSARAGKPPMAWGHELRQLKELKPLPFKLADFEKKA